MAKRNAEYMRVRNLLIRNLYRALRNAGNSARYSYLVIQKELKGELSIERIRKIVYEK